MAYGDIRKLSPSQKRIIGEIIAGGIRAGKKYGWSPRQIRMAINTGLAVGYTEARFSNPEGGDRDSGGWRQERRMYYKNPTNVKASVDRFYSEYQADASKTAPLGVRAQQVQQSGTPHVWDTLRPLANQIRKEFTGRLNLGGGGGGGGRQLAKYTPGSVDPGGTETDFGAAILDKFLSGDKRPLFQTLVSASENPAYTTTTPPSRTAPKARYKVGAAGPGDVLRASGQIRKDGWKGAKSAGAPLVRIANKLGLNHISEKRPTQMTASGGVSDHYEGNKDSYAWDLSNGSSPTKEMDAAALRIARALGAEKQWRSQGRSGVLNVTKKIDGRTYRFQMLYRTNVGGNHYNHVHLGVDRVDTPG